MFRGPTVAGLFLFAFAFAAQAAEVGHIENVAGHVSLFHEGQESPVAAGSLVQLNDVIRTDADALLRIKLNDGSALTVAENSELRVALFDKDMEQALIEMLHGRLRAEVEPHKKPGARFVVRTPTASALAIGTVLEVQTASTSSALTTQEIENLPLANGRTMSALQTAYAVGTAIKPTESGNSFSPKKPTNLWDFTPGTFRESSLGGYAFPSQTFVTSLDHYVVTENNNSKFPGMTFLLPGQTSVTGGNAKSTLVNDYGADLGGPIIKDKLWFWGSGKFNIGSRSATSSNLIGDFDASGKPCQPGVVLNGEPISMGGPLPGFNSKILGMGTSTGSALQVSVTNPGTCPLFYMVTAGMIMHPKGFTGRVVGEFLLGGVPNLKDFQKMITFGLFIRVSFANVLGAGPAVPAGGEASVPMRSYCVELHKLAPHPKTEYKFGDAGDQEKLGVNLPVLERTLRLWQTNQLPTDKGHGLDDIIQWSLWAKIEKMDEKEFMQQYMNLVHKNYEARKMKWDKNAQAMVETSGKDLWKMVQAVLQ